MTDQKGDTTNFLGTVITIALFLFIISFFPGKPLHRTSCSYHYALNSEFSLNHSKAVAIDAIQIPSAQNSCLYIAYNETINLYNETNKVIADNRKINQQIILRQKAELLIKPSLPKRFCLYCIRISNEEIPIFG